MYNNYNGDGTVTDRLLETYSEGFWSTEGLKSMAQELIRRRKKEKELQSLLNYLVSGNQIDTEYMNLVFGYKSI